MESKKLYPYELVPESMRDVVTPHLWSILGRYHKYTEFIEIFLAAKRDRKAVQLYLEDVAQYHKYRVRMNEYKNIAMQSELQLLAEAQLLIKCGFQKAIQSLSFSN